MAKKKEKKYRIASIYDTETCNIDVVEDGIKVHRAYPILFIFNDITTSIENYTIDSSDDVKFIRNEDEAVDHIKKIINNNDGDAVPIIAAYNLAFDIQPILELLAQDYDVRVCAQSSSNIYYLDLYIGEYHALRFWDTFFLDPLGLADMGLQCGIEKAAGDWDYTLIRTPETPLTDLELYYAKRDVQVIPAYLKFILDTNDYLLENDLGNHVLTKTSIVRVMAKRITGELSYQGPSMKKARSTKSMAYMMCKEGQARTYEQYAMQKACFRGGLTFTAANYADQVIHNVASLDVTSMHHAFINGVMVPKHFAKKEPRILQRWANKVLDTSLDDLLKFYHMPFNHAFHARIKFINLRLKAGSAFEHYGIATLAAAKFATTATSVVGDRNEAKEAADQWTRDQGYYDRALGTEEHPLQYAFSKLIKADTSIVFVNEIELWLMGNVYDWDSMEVLDGEGTSEYMRPLDYVTLQSNMLYKKKAEIKNIKKRYREGTPYDGDVSDLIPATIADRIKRGTIDSTFIDGYYNLTKQYLNSIYGSQAQDIHKPGYIYDGAIRVNEDEKTSPDHFSTVKSTYVLYTYGQRIVGRSRMHLVIAIMLLYAAFGDDVIISGGDTDSIKIGTAEHITDQDLLDALEPLHAAIRAAIGRTMQTIRAAFPAYTDPLEHVGEFEIENDVRYPHHMEAWNKARISIDHEGRAHITCAGVSRPSGRYTLEDLATDAIAAGYDVEHIMHSVLGYNTTFLANISHLLGHHKPGYDEIIDLDVRDYLGHKHHVHAHQAIALYPSEKTIGDADTYKGRIINMQNGCNVAYLESIGHKPDLSHILLYVDDKNAYIYNEDTDTTEEIPRSWK